MHTPWIEASSPLGHTEKHRLPLNQLTYLTSRQTKCYLTLDDTSSNVTHAIEGDMSSPKLEKTISHAKVDDL